ncbi:MAG TPA: cyclic nucleotide-binding domain-containing protein, partial [Hymenobacter sp.]
PQLRLAAHTLAKGFYEPLGMGLTGLLFFVFGYVGLLGSWAPFLWMGALLLVALWFLRRTYTSYLAELKEGLGQRFTETAELALPDEALQVVLAHLQSPRATEVLNAVAWLRQREPDTLAQHVPTLLEHPAEQVRFALLATPEVRPLPLEALQALALRDPAPAVREAAAQQLATAAPGAPAVATLLNGADLPARQGAIRGALTLDSEHGQAQASLQQLLTDEQPAASRVALALLAFLPLEAQKRLIDRSLAPPDVGLARPALTALGTVGHTQLAHYLLEALTIKQRWQLAADSLVALGPAVVPLLRDALVHAHSNVLVHRLASVLERLGSAASRAALVGLAQHSDLFHRLVALRALRRFPAEPAEAPVFERLLQEEFALAAALLRGLAADRRPALHAAVNYELDLLHQRIFGLLAQLYDADLVATAQRNVAHTARERQANALEILDNLIPRPIYQGLQALLDDAPVAEKAQLFATLTAPGTSRAHAGSNGHSAAQAGNGAAVVALPLTASAPTETLPALLLRRGHTAFTTWTLSVALRHWQPTAGSSAALLRPYLHSPTALLAESAQLAAEAWAARTGQPFPDFTASTSAMSHRSAVEEARVSALERVVVLKSTALFAQTPENVLSSIVPIMKEVTFQEGQEIFAKGEIGTSLFILHDGQVGIFNGNQQLATFGPGDYFGELALLDTEPRSASAAALSQVLAFRIDQEDFYDVMEERAEVLRNMLRMLCQRIRQQNEKMRELAP